MKAINSSMNWNVLNRKYYDYAVRKMRKDEIPMTIGKYAKRVSKLYPKATPASKPMHPYCVINEQYRG